MRYSSIIFNDVRSEDGFTKMPRYLLQTLKSTISDKIRYEDTLFLDTTPREKSITYTAPLKTVIDGALKGLDRNKFIR